MDAIPFASQFSMRLVRYRIWHLFFTIFLAALLVAGWQFRQIARTGFVRVVNRTDRTVSGYFVVRNKRTFSIPYIKAGNSWSTRVLVDEYEDVRVELSDDGGNIIMFWPRRFSRYPPYGEEKKFIAETQLFRPLQPLPKANVAANSLQVLTVQREIKVDSAKPESKEK
jgi:hypothetical protein